MQVFKLVVGGAPDKIIAFDELPERLLKGIDMREPSGFPRAWKTFLGHKTKVMKGATYKRVGIADQVVPDMEIKGPFFYVIDTLSNLDSERWQEITSFVKRVVPPEIRLLEKIEDMALPLAVDSRSEMTLEPEHLEERGAIVPIPLEYQEKTVDKAGQPIAPPVNEIVDAMLKCAECDKKFTGKQALNMHVMRVHKMIGGRKKAVA